MFVAAPVSGSVTVPVTVQLPLAAMVLGLTVKLVAAAPPPSEPPEQLVIVAVESCRRGSSQLTVDARVSPCPRSGW